MATLALLVVGGVVLAPWLLDTYMVNILIRAFLRRDCGGHRGYHVGLLRHAEHSVIGLLRHGCHALAIVFTNSVLGPAVFAMGAAIIISGVVAALTLALILSGFNSALRINRVACPSDRPRTDSLLGRTLRIVQRARRIRDIRSVARELVSSGRP